MPQINNAKATFVAEGGPDTEARVQPRENGGVDFRVDTEGFRLAHGTATATETLQLAESLQFVSDVISASIPGRLSPFVRGWINVAADAHQIARGEGSWGEGTDAEIGLKKIQEAAFGNTPDPVFPEFKVAEIAFAAAAMKIMDLAHAGGYRLPQAIEAITKNGGYRAVVPRS